jgi:glutamate 5-kinase
MGSKLEAAQLMVDAGYLSIIADGRRASCISSVFKGKDVGTLIGTLNSGSSIGSGKKKWLAVFQRAQGSLEIDEGASRAIHLKGTSLLPAGVKSVIGSFEQGALVNILNVEGKIIARGLVDYSSGDINKIKGLRTSEIQAVLGAKYYDEVVHRDNMVLLIDSGVNEDV